MKQVAVGIITRQNIDGETEYLLVRSKKDFGEFSGHYYPPVGHVEAGESPTEGLVREVKEELGLVVAPIKELDVSLGDVANQETHWWLCKMEEGEIQIQEEEIGDAGFFTLEQMKAMPLWPATKQFFNNHIFGNEVL